MKNIINNFLGGRVLPNNFKEFLVNNSKLIEKPLYRGLPFPKHLLREGAVIEEWYGASHWSFSEDIARDFSLDYINEDYAEELANEIGEENLEFVPLILISSDIVGVDMRPLIEEYGLKEDYGHEQEVVVIGRNFTITYLETRRINDEIFYFANVE